MHDLSGKRVLVMGLGRFGGGVGVSRWLASQGAHITVTDLEPADRLTDSLAAIADLTAAAQVTLKLGGHDEADFTAADLVIANPAVPRPWANPYLSAAAAAGVPITTEIALLIQRLPSRARTIAITGSVGKSTTTAMIHHALSNVTDDAVIGGNLGGSLLNSLDTITPRTWVVLELSSAMLHWLSAASGDPARWSPHIAVVTPFAPNHLDWHGDLDHYRTSKQHILRRQAAGDFAILAPTVADWASLTPARTEITGPATFPEHLAIPGRHNLENAAAALAACRAAEPEIDPQHFIDAIATFPGLPHRMQLVTTLEGGIRVYNDSKSTTPGATLTAIQAIAETPGLSRARIHLIAGGYDKQIDLTPIANAAADLAGLYTVGATGPSLADKAAAAGAVAEYAGTIDQAVEAALSRAEPGDVLLLSPGCASWDQFQNFEKRGEAFIRAVHDVPRVRRDSGNPCPAPSTRA